MPHWSFDLNCIVDMFDAKDITAIEEVTRLLAVCLCNVILLQYE